MPERAGPSLVASLSDGTYLSHPLAVVPLLTVLERLSSQVPREATWTVEGE